MEVFAKVANNLKYFISLHHGNYEFGFGVVNNLCV